MQGKRFTITITKMLYRSGGNTVITIPRQILKKTGWKEGDMVQAILTKKNMPIRGR